jgi:hypothetical protein
MSDWCTLLKFDIYSLFYHLEMDNEYDIVNLLLNKVYMFDLSSENIKPIWLIFFKLSFKLVESGL